MSRSHGNCFDVQEDVQQGPQIGHVHKALPAPLDGLPEELWQMIKNSLQFHDLDHGSMENLEQEGKQLTSNHKDKNVPKQVTMRGVKVLLRIARLN